MLVKISQDKEFAPILLNNLHFVILIGQILNSEQQKNQFDTLLA